MGKFRAPLYTPPFFGTLIPGGGVYAPQNKVVGSVWGSIWWDAAAGGGTPGNATWTTQTAGFALGSVGATGAATASFTTQTGSAAVGAVTAAGAASAAWTVQSATWGLGSMGAAGAATASWGTQAASFALGSIGAVASGMLISFVNQGMPGNPPTLPTGWQPGDLFLGCFYGTVSAPTGWSQIGDTGTNFFIVAYRVAQAGDTAPSVATWSPGILAFRHVDQASPVQTSSSNSGFSSTATATSVTTAADNEMIVVLSQENDTDGISSVAPPPWPTNVAWNNNQGSDSSYYYAVSLSYGLKSPAGATGDQAMSVSNLLWNAYQFALTADGGGAGGAPPEPPWRPARYRSGTYTPWWKRPQFRRAPRRR
jgi:hypothetical protein